MVEGTFLCRFRRGDQGAAHLGLVVGGQVYDLTALRAPEYTTLAAWLYRADSDLAGALTDLAETALRREPLCTAAALAAEEGDLHLLAPLDNQEVWACGVTYTMSRAARMRESQEPTIYGRVYDAPRPEIFFKATPSRVVGPWEAVGIRCDSRWDVPEPELTLVVTPNLQIVGYTVGNDMSSRDIEGQNPLYLPQAKIYDRCCALGPWVRLAPPTGTPGPRRALHHPAGRGGSAERAANIHRPIDDLVAPAAEATPPGCW